MIPSFMIQLNKAHAPLDQASRQQAVVCERFLARFCAVHIHGRLGFPGQIHEFRSAGLHPIGHFVIVNASLNFRILPIGQSLLIQGIDQSNGPFLNRSINPMRTGHVQNGIPFRTKRNTGMNGRQKPRTPIGSAPADPSGGFQHHETGQIRGLTTQSVGGPRSHGGSARKRASGVQKDLSRRMIELVCVHRFDDADFVHHFT